VAQDVIFAGFVDDVSSFFAALDIFAFPAHEPEGFGMAVAEAMVAGLAIVATRLGGISEIVEHGASGCLVEPGSVDALARALLDLTRDPPKRSRMGSAAQSRAQQFSAARGVAQLQSLYLNLQ
jgi:glycosyltransferase involved in cell wall biosynthesis